MGGCLFDNVTKDMLIYKEEIFGPVVCAENLIRVADVMESPKLAE
jgi:malonate-semialdehyde dehydrogenase (acetylating) / methylmalonate-semialdehyde dehydrogenase